MDLNLFLCMALNFIIWTRLKTTGKQCQEFVFDPWNYLDCIQDTHTRSLPYLYMNTGSYEHMDNNRCILYCKDNEFNFAGTTYSTWCFCGNDPYRLRNTVINPYYIQNYDCNYKCGGNQSQICGGYWRLSVYSTGFNNTNQKYRRIGNKQLVAKAIAEITLKNTWNIYVLCALQCKRQTGCGVFSVTDGMCKMYQYEDVCDGYLANTVASVYLLR